MFGRFFEVVVYIEVETVGFRIRENWIQILTVICYLYDIEKFPSVTDEDENEFCTSWGCCD